MRQNSRLEYVHTSSLRKMEGTADKRRGDSLHGYYDYLWNEASASFKMYFYVLNLCSLLDQK